MLFAYWQIRKDIIEFEQDGKVKAEYGNQTFSAENPPVTLGQGKKKVITWVSFLFTSNNEPVIPLLEKSVIGVSKIETELIEM